MQIKVAALPTLKGWERLIYPVRYQSKVKLNYFKWNFWGPEANIRRTFTFKFTAPVSKFGT